MSFESALQRLRPPGATSPRVQRTLLAVALVVFVTMAVVAIASFPDDLDPHPRWWLLVAVGVGGPLATVVLNGLEYTQQGRLVGRTIALRSALRVSVLGTAANLLPIPGSVIVRTGALAEGEVGVKRAAASTATVGVAWLGASALVAGALQPFAGRTWLGVVLVVIGTALLGSTWMLVQRSQASDPGSLFTSIVAVEIGTVVIGALRLFGFIAGLGLDVNAAQVVGLTLAGVLASATGVFPAGIGIREGLIAAASPLLDLPAAVGLLAAAADRLAGLVMLAVLTTLLVVTRGSSTTPGVPDRPTTRP
jgi:hypothetical protein